MAGWAMRHRRATAVGFVIVTLMVKHRSGDRYLAKAALMRLGDA
jgi:hypothetical protein